MTKTIDLDTFAQLSSEELERLCIEDAESAEQLERVAENADILANFAVSWTDHYREYESDE